MYSKNTQAKKAVISLKKETGSEIQYSIVKLSDKNNIPEFEHIIGRLYPYYDKRKVLPLSAWGYIFNESNPKKPIFWPSSMEQFQSFTELMDRLGLIGHFKKVEKVVNGQKKSEIVCLKLGDIRHAPLGHSAPGED